MFEHRKRLSQCPYPYVEPRSCEKNSPVRAEDHAKNVHIMHERFSNGAVIGRIPELQVVIAAARCNDSTIRRKGQALKRHLVSSDFAKTTSGWTVPNQKLTVITPR